MLPSCFTPSAACVELLQRVVDGLTVDQQDAAHMVYVGLLRPLVGPTSGSGYTLTDDGREALRRAQEVK